MVIGICICITKKDLEEKKSADTRGFSSSVECRMSEKEPVGRSKMCRSIQILRNSYNICTCTTYIALMVEEPLAEKLPIDNELRAMNNEQ